MNHFFLLNKAIDLQDYEKFKIGMSELNTVKQAEGEDDTFSKHASIWDLIIITKLYETFGQEEQVIFKFIEQLDNLDNYISDETAFDKAYPNSDNAFLGIDFSSTNIPQNRQIVDENAFKAFKIMLLKEIDFRNLWAKRAQKFPSLILCGVVESQIAQIGKSSAFNQMVSRLEELDKAARTWQEGAFSYKDINKHFALNISPESKLTMDNYGNERKFKLPNGKIEFFELHIKTGDLRFHFFPDNTARKVYIGYIGKHLRTWKYD